MGLEVLLPPPAPDAAPSVTLKAGNGQASDAELIQHARRDRPVVLQAEGTTPFGEVVHAVDVCRAEGAGLSRHADEVSRKDAGVCRVRRRILRAASNSIGPLRYYNSLVVAWPSMASEAFELS